MTNRERPFLSPPKNAYVSFSWFFFPVPPPSHRWEPPLFLPHLLLASCFALLLRSLRGIISCPPCETPAHHSPDKRGSTIHRGKGRPRKVIAEPQTLPKFCYQLSNFCMGGIPSSIDGNNSMELKILAPPPPPPADFRGLM